MSVLFHFDESDEDYLIFRLKESIAENLKDTLPNLFRACYIEDDKLLDSMKALSLDYKEIMNSYLPDEGNVKAGEFGEILSFFLLKEKHHHLNLWGPKKWLWKDDKNKPVQKTDVILFHRNEVVSSEDVLISAEVKCKSTKSNRDPIKDAVEGAKDDYLKRLAITMNWLNDKYVKEINVEKINTLKRFRNPVKFGEFTTLYKAIAVIDKSFEIDEFKKTREIDVFNGLEIIVISIDMLKDTYENTYMGIYDKGGEFLA
ncbi:Hachiman antiphage defense system protein HamA [Shouchella sp. JSM 1781072]|uniref:Hachiman antiphage defense system protein HamA n=1 Tax=Shouchella sp. JSM 1781072 TaxID=3344581 RepID=UPI0035BEF1CB